MDKNFTTKQKDGLSYGRGYVYSLQYHIVWCTKYRKPVMNGIYAQSCKEMLYKIAEDYKFTIMELEVMPDHIHMLVDCKPQFCIANMIKILKGNTARWLFIQYPELKKQLYGGHLWNPSYCAVTVSERSLFYVQEYIKNQKG